MHRAEEAYALARDATARDPLTAKLWVDRAEAAKAANHPDDALDALHKAVAVAPGWPPLARELADALTEAGEDDEAIRALERAVTRNPLDAWVRWQLADRLWQADRGDDALDHAKASVRHEPPYDPDMPGRPDLAWGAVMYWSDRLFRPEEAADLAREQTRDRAGDPRAWVRLARTLNDFGEADEILGALDKALELDPKNVEAYDLKAERLAQLGRFDEALDTARPSVLATDLPLILQGRAAWIEARRGNYEMAIPPMQALVAVDPEYVWGWQQLAEWYNDIGRSDDYLQAADELCRLRPEHPMSLTMRGEAKLQTGDREAGKEDLREVLRAFANYSPAAAILFDACLADDEMTEARTAPGCPPGTDDRSRGTGQADAVRGQAGRPRGRRPGVRGALSGAVRGVGHVPANGPDPNANGRPRRPVSRPDAGRLGGRRGRRQRRRVQPVGGDPLARLAGRRRSSD